MLKKHARKEVFAIGEGKNQSSIAAFDTLFTTGQLQRLKILLPHLQIKLQGQLAVYIKYMEFRFALDFLKQFPQAGVLPYEGITDPPSLCDEMLPYCSAAERRQFEGMKSTLASFSRYQEMLETLRMMQELFPEGGQTIDPDMMSMFFGGDMSEQMEAVMKAMNPASEDLNPDKKQ